MTNRSKMTLWELKNMYVYFVRSGSKGAIKIGVAKNMKRRLETLQTGNQYKLEVISLIPCSSKEQAYYLEKRLHAMFKRQRIRGEWFQGNIKLDRIKEEMLEQEEVESELAMEANTYI